MLDTSVPGVNRLFVAGFNDNDNGANPPVDDANRVLRNAHRKYFFPRVDIKDNNILTDGRYFCDQNISDDFKNYEELRKVMTGRGEDYTGSLLDYDYWKNNFKLICCDLCRQNVLDSNPKANQQIEFVNKLDNTRNVGGGHREQILTVLEKEKETNLEFSKGTVRVY